MIFDGYRDSRDQVYENLMRAGITARKYFYPLSNDYECYRDFPTAGVDKTPVAQHIADRVLTLPLYADLEDSAVDDICRIILG